MAESPAHKFGQIIGNFIEELFRPYLIEFCEKNDLYLDYQGRDRPARKGKKISWSDSFDNKHDLDFVIEKGGSDTQIGNPIAFIECAWRRYTKHSRNKAQEIQGAILPLAQKYGNNNPFLGAVLAGIFTDGSLDQLSSNGFNILYFTYDTIIEAFSTQGINIAFDEETPDENYQQTIEVIDSLSSPDISRISENLIQLNEGKIETFLSALNERLTREIEKIIIIPLYGYRNEFVELNSAIQFLEGHAIYEVRGEFRFYEIIVSFTNGDKLEASLNSKSRALDFLIFVSKQ